MPEAEPLPELKPQLPEPEPAPTTEDLEAARARLEKATNQKADEAIALTKAGQKQGPCQSGVLDTKTNEMFFGRNTRGAPENLHPVLRTRLSDYLARTGGNTPARAGTLTPGFGKGTHAEINALNDAFFACEQSGLGPVTEANMNEFLVHNINLLPARQGLPMPRCGNCFNITQGAEVTPGVDTAETEFYNQEYGPDFRSSGGSYPAPEGK